MNSSCGRLRDLSGCRSSERRSVRDTRPVIWPTGLRMAEPSPPWGARGLMALLVAVLVACMPAAPSQYDDLEIAIPAQSDWTDYGSIFEAGQPGEWDLYLWGGFAGTAVKKEGTYYLYYQGASDYRTAYDESVMWRAIGVATSPDGVNFEKYGGNPLLTWFPNDNVEEGAVSGSAVLNEEGDLVLVYGANTEESATTVNADARRATSTDGFTFTDRGIVLDRTDRSVWASGDELFPIVAIRDEGRWFVYYIPNGVLQRGRLGVAWGTDLHHLDRSSAVRAGGATVRVWGMGGAARVGQGVYALFLNRVVESRTEVRLVSLGRPDRLSAPVETYRFEGVRQATVLLDEEARTWFMYSRGEDMYGVKLAPAGEPDTTPPTVPELLTAVAVSDGHVELSWRPATDPDTGIAVYKVYRDGAYLDTVKGWSYSDGDPPANTGCSYEVSAVNYHGLEGPRSLPVPVTTGDVTLPDAPTSR